MISKSTESSSKEARRLAIYVRNGFFSGDTRGATIKRATSVDELERVFALVHDIYVRQGFIPPSSSRLRMRPYDTTCDTTYFIAVYKDDVVGSSGIVIDSDDLGVPSDNLYGDVLDGLREKESTTIFEATSQALEPAFRNTGVLFELQRCLFIQSIDMGCTDLVATCSLSQKSYYELIGFEQIGPVRNYRVGTKDSVVLMRLRTQEMHEVLFSRPETGSFLERLSVTENPYREKLWQWRQQAKNTYRNQQAMVELFSKCPSLFHNASLNEERAMKKRLGEQLYDRILEQINAAARLVRSA